MIKKLVIPVLPLLPIAHEQQNLLRLARSSAMMFRQRRFSFRCFQGHTQIQRWGDSRLVAKLCHWTNDEGRSLHWQENQGHRFGRDGAGPCKITLVVLVSPLCIYSPTFFLQAYKSRRADGFHRAQYHCPFRKKCGCVFAISVKTYRDKVMLFVSGEHTPDSHKGGKGALTVKQQSLMAERIPSHRIDDTEESMTKLAMSLSLKTAIKRHSDPADDYHMEAHQVVCLEFEFKDGVTLWCYPLRTWLWTWHELFNAGGRFKAIGTALSIGATRTWICINLWFDKRCSYS